MMAQESTAHKKKLLSTGEAPTEASSSGQTRPAGVSLLPSGTKGILTTLAGQNVQRMLLPALLASFLFIAYGFYGFVVPQTPGRLARPSAALITELPFWSFIVSLPLPIPDDCWQLAAWLIFFTAMAFAAYSISLYISWKWREALAPVVVVAAAVIFFLVSTVSLPTINSDIFHYILQGRQAIIYQSNPYYTPANEFSDDPIYPYASAKYVDRTGDKLPAWMLLNMLMAGIATDNPVTSLLVYRSILCLFNIVNLALIILILRRLKSSYLLTGTVLYGWNPIVFLFGSSKTDTIMVFYLLLAVLLLVSKRKSLAIIPLGLSVLVKLVTLPLTAVYLIGHIRSGKWHQFLVGSLLFSLTAVLLYVWFWQGSDLLLSLFWLLRDGGVDAPSLLWWLFRIVFVLLILWVGFIQDGTTQRLLWGWGIVALYICLFFTRLGYAWYLITFIALAGIAGSWRLALLAVVVSFSSFFINIWYSAFTQRFPAPELLTLPTFLIYLILPGIAVFILATSRWIQSPGLFPLSPVKRRTG